jgi:hypothetical protein
MSAHALYFKNKNKNKNQNGNYKRIKKRKKNLRKVKRGIRVLRG